MKQPKLTYDQWCEQHMATVDPAVREALHEIHGIDADTEIEQARRQEYEFYVRGGFDQ
jgi:hypothetical protein